MADVLDVIQSRSSVRGYTQAALSDVEIKTLVEAGLHAPTAKNAQELHFSIVSTDSKVIEEIGNDLNPENPLGFLYGAPILIVISGRDDFGWSAVDAGIAVENIHLAACDLDLGSVIIGCINGVLHGEKKEYYQRLLSIPEGYSFQIAIAVGHAATSKEPHEINYEKNVSTIK